jgi:membrane protein YqaA with SNARE-associated domain
MSPTPSQDLPAPPADSPRVSAEELRAAEAPVVVSRWAIHRHLYDWVLRFAHHRHSTTALATLSFVESSVFPIPPDVLLMPMCLERRNRAMWYATVCTAASVLGGVAGYSIGAVVWSAVSEFFFSYVISQDTFGKAQQLYHDWDFWAVFVAGLTPIPYKVFTIAAGVFDISLPMFMLASIVGRGARFYLLAALAWKFGAPIVRFVDRYFNLLCVAVVLVGLGGFAALKFMR